MGSEALDLAELKKEKQTPGKAAARPRARAWSGAAWVPKGKASIATWACCCCPSEAMAAWWWCDVLVDVEDGT